MVDFHKNVQQLWLHLDVTFSLLLLHLLKNYINFNHYWMWILTLIYWKEKNAVAIVTKFNTSQADLSQVNFSSLRTEIENSDLCGTLIRSVMIINGNSEFWVIPFKNLQWGLGKFYKNEKELWFDLDFSSHPITSASVEIVYSILKALLIVFFKTIM